MSYEADFFAFGNNPKDPQWIAGNTTVPLTLWWSDGKPDEYFDVLIMPVAPNTALQEVGRAMVNDEEGHSILVLTIANTQNLPVQFVTNYIRIPNH